MHSFIVNSLNFIDIFNDSFQNRFKLCKYDFASTFI